MFVISLGFYITPAALGSLKDTMLSNLTASLINGTLDFNFAAAILVVMLIVTLLFYFLVGGGLGSLRQERGDWHRHHSRSGQRRWVVGRIENSGLAAGLSREWWSRRVGRPRALPRLGRVGPRSV